LEPQSSESLSKTENRWDFLTVVHRIVSSWAWASLVEMLGSAKIRETTWLFLIFRIFIMIARCSKYHFWNLGKFGKNHISGLKILLTLVRISNVWHIGWDHEWNIMNFWFHPSSEVLKLLNNINSRVLYRPKHRLWSLENKKLNHIINFWMISILVLCEGIWKKSHLRSEAHNGNGRDIPYWLGSVREVPWITQLGAQG